MSIQNEELQQLDEHGFIAGPGESEETFLRRVAHCLQLKRSLPIHNLIPQETKENGEKALLEALPLSKKTYNISPDWVPCYITNYKLAPWHGGAWIFQETKESPLGAFLQLRRTLPSWYKKNELIVHELAHVGRMQFQEKRFEEMIAYESSSKGWQHLLGPLIRSPWESLLFVSLLLVLLLLDFIGGISLYQKLLPLKLIPLGLILLATLRLFWTRRTFSKAKSNLAELVLDGTLPVLYRLTDEEIATFAKLSKEQIVDFIEKKKDSELRWRQIYLYFRR